MNSNKLSVIATSETWREIERKVSFYYPLKRVIFLSIFQACGGFNECRKTDYVKMHKGVKIILEKFQALRGF